MWSILSIEGRQFGLHHEDGEIWSIEEREFGLRHEYGQFDLLSEDGLVGTTNTINIEEQ